MKALKMVRGINVRNFRIEFKKNATKNLLFTEYFLVVILLFMVSKLKLEVPRLISY